MKRLVFLFLAGLFLLTNTSSVFAQKNQSIPIRWKTSDILFEADKFSLSINGKEYQGNAANALVHSYYYPPSYLGLESQWQVNGSQISAYFTFSARNNKWKLDYVNTYSPYSQPNWIGYTKGFERVSAKRESSSYTPSVELYSPYYQNKGIMRFQNLRVSIPSFDLRNKQQPMIESVTVAPCGSSSCRNITTVIVNGKNFENHIQVAAIGLLDKISYSQPYAIIVGRTGATQLIIDFNGLPCNQQYKIHLYFDRPDNRSAQSTDIFTPTNACL